MEKGLTRRQLRQKAYNDKRWIHLSRAYRITHPVCEICGKHLTEAVHHKKSPFERGISDDEKERRMFDEDNLQAVCVDCHLEEHGLKRKEYFDPLFGRKMEDDFFS